jgi:hypothetical protein
VIASAEKPEMNICSYTAQTQELIGSLKGKATQDLLQVCKKLMVPPKYKNLVKMQECVDSTLNFLASRHADFVPLKEVQQSVASSHGKGFTLTMLRQIIHFCPQFFEIKWQEQK